LDFFLFRQRESLAAGDELLGELPHLLLHGEALQEGLAQALPLLQGLGLQEPVEKQQTNSSIYGQRSFSGASLNLSTNDLEHLELLCGNSVSLKIIIYIFMAICLAMTPNTFERKTHWTSCQRKLFATARQRTKRSN
jgi:hypothetical protein